MAPSQEAQAEQPTEAEVREFAMQLLAAGRSPAEILHELLDAGVTLPLASAGVDAIAADYARLNAAAEAAAQEAFPFSGPSSPAPAVGPALQVVQIPGQGAISFPVHLSDVPVRTMPESFGWIPLIIAGGVFCAATGELFMGGDLIDFVSQLAYGSLFVLYDVLRRKNRTVLTFWGHGVIAIYRKAKFSQMISDMQLKRHQLDVFEIITRSILVMLAWRGFGVLSKAHDAQGFLYTFVTHLVFGCVVASLVRIRFFGQRFIIPRASWWLSEERIYVAKKDLIHSR